MTEPHLTLTVLNDTFAVCRLEPRYAIPAWAVSSAFSSITRTPDELSVVCRQSDVPAGVACENDWRCLQVQGPLDFELTGILASLASTLAKAGVSIFAVSTFDTDYILVKQNDLLRAIQSLSEAGHFMQA
jgi:hypothetical protein